MKNKIYYVYDNHVGADYVTTRKIQDEYLYCEQCGDSDWLKYSGTKSGIMRQINDDFKSNGYEPFEYEDYMEYILEQIAELESE